MMFEQYKREQIAELRPVTETDINNFKSDQYVHSIKDTQFRVSISDVDKENGSPKIGDMIARNPENHLDQWLVAKQYFENNFKQKEEKSIIFELIKELSKDKSEGSYYHSWQSNIAMAFYDEFLEHREKVKRENMKSKDIHEIANNAAKRFLDQLMARKMMKKDQ